MSDTTGMHNSTISDESSDEKKSDILPVTITHSIKQGEIDTELLKKLTDMQHFEVLLSNDVLYKYFDTDRCFKIVGWTFVHGYKKGIVPILYMYIRNIIKPSTGMVLSESMFNNALIAVVYMLMRTAQDVVACQRILASKEALKTYSIIRTKLDRWLDKFKNREWPELSTVIVTNEKLNPGESVVYPSPVWCTNCKSSMFSTMTIYFGTPKEEFINSANETVSHVDALRKKVARDFVEWVKDLKWHEFLTKDFPGTE